MTATALVIAFPARTAQSLRFGLQDRNAIIAAAMALSRGWGASFFTDDQDAERASMGLQSAGEDAWDRFGFAILGRGRIELVDLEDPETASVHRTVPEAIEAMRGVLTREG